MLELKSHLDEFTLLRYIADELDEAERGEAGRHLEMCSACSERLDQVHQLDAELQILARDRDNFAEEHASALPKEDPFCKRPENDAWRKRERGSSQLIEAAVTASRQGAEKKARVLEAVVGSREMHALLGSLSFSEPADRYALLYALQEAGQRIAENPVQMRRFGEEVLERWRRDGSEAAERDRGAERMVPKLTLLGHAHQLAGQACTWMGEYEMAQTHFQLAYSSFGRADDETSLAFVELLEAQRRFFIGRGEEALELARRAAATFEVYGLDEACAKARGSQGMALLRLGRADEALECCYAALEVFENRELWSNYVGIVNNIAVCLVNLGRLDDARREYARALRHLSRSEHRSFLAFIRHGLAEVLFAAERYREAARSVWRARLLYINCGLRANALGAWLFEIESWARAGDLAKARESLSAFLSHLSGEQSLDSAVVRRVEEALSGLDPDFRNIAELRQHAETILPPSSRGLSA